MNVLLIDDHPLILQALQTVMQGLGDTTRVAGVPTAAAARARLAAGDAFDLVLLDLQLADADGHELLLELRAEHPALPVVVLSASEAQGDVLRAIDGGAMGFIPKRLGTQEMLDALRLVLEGSVFIPTPAALGAGPRRSAAAEIVVHEPPADLRTVVREGRAPGLERLSLTPRQKDVLACLLQGRPNKLIARELGLSVETVKDHVAAVLRALGVATRTQAVLAVSELARHDAGAPGWRATAS